MKGVDLESVRFVFYYSCHVLSCDPILYDVALLKSRRGVAQPGSAPAWGAGGRRFKSSRPDHIFNELQSR